MSSIPFFASSRLADAVFAMSLPERAAFFELVAEEAADSDIAAWGTPKQKSFTHWACRLGAQIAEEHGGQGRRKDLEQLAPVMAQFTATTPLTPDEKEAVADFLTELWDCLVDYSDSPPELDNDLRVVMAAYAPVMRSWVARGFQPAGGPQAFALAAAAMATKDAAFLQDLSRLKRCPLGLFSTTPGLANMPGSAGTFLAAGGDFEEKIDRLSVSTWLCSMKCQDQAFRKWLWSSSPKDAGDLEFDLVEQALEHSKFATSPSAQAALGLARPDWFNIEGANRVPIWVAHALDTLEGLTSAIKKKAQLEGDPDRVWCYILQRAAASSLPSARLESFDQKGLLDVLLTRLLPQEGALAPQHKCASASAWFESARLRDLLFSRNSSPEFWLGTPAHQRKHGQRLVELIAEMPTRTSDAIARLTLRLKLKESPHPMLATALAVAFAASNREAPPLVKAAADPALIGKAMWSRLAEAHPKMPAALQLSLLETKVAVAAPCARPRL